jgi:putative (di)nucleoside polyphosphate hydrolase
VPNHSSKPPVEKFRPCVAALLINTEGKLLICERHDFANSWQFPQGGRDFGETPREALARELWEEISLLPAHYDVGQQQVYFRCQFHGPDSLLNLETKQPEFRDYRWIEPAEFDLLWLPEFKRDVYRKVINDFFGVEPQGVGVSGGGPEVRFRK